MNNIIDIYDTCNTIDIYNETIFDLDSDIHCMYIHFADDKVSYEINDVTYNVDYYNGWLKIPFGNVIAKFKICYIKINMYDVEFEYQPSIIYHHRELYDDIIIFDGTEYYIDTIHNNVDLSFCRSKKTGYVQILYCNVNNYYHYYDFDDMFYRLIEFTCNSYTDLYIGTFCANVIKIHNNFRSVNAIYIDHDNMQYTKHKLIKKLQIPFVHKNKNGTLYLECYDNTSKYYRYIIEKISYDDITINFIQTKKCKCNIFKIQHVDDDKFVRGLKCICFHKKILQKIESIGLYDLRIPI